MKTNAKNRVRMNESILRGVLCPQQVADSYRRPTGLTPSIYSYGVRLLYTSYFNGRVAQWKRPGYAVDQSICLLSRRSQVQVLPRLPNPPGSSTLSTSLVSTHGCGNKLKSPGVVDPLPAPKTGQMLAVLDRAGPRAFIMDRSGPGKKPLAIDLYSGLGGWAEGFLSEGWRIVGFDNQPQPYPGEFVQQDVTTLDGAQFRDAAVIVASPPCQAYSYRAMPWKRAKALPPPDNTLFEACFRIQREASAAAGHHIPLIVENVRGAQKWVGRARWHYGSYYLWGDVPALMPIAGRQPKYILDDVKNGQRRNIPGIYRDGAVKNKGGSWFAVANNTTSGVGNNPDGRKVDHHLNGDVPEGTGKTSWFFGNTKHELRATSSGSQARKHASAMIAKIPLPLARHIARVFKPDLLPNAGLFTADSSRTVAGSIPASPNQSSGGGS